MRHDGVDQDDVRSRLAADQDVLSEASPIEENGGIGRIGKESVRGDLKDHGLTNATAAMHDRRRLGRDMGLSAGFDADSAAQRLSVIEAARYGLYKERGKTARLAIQIEGACQVVGIAGELPGEVCSPRGRAFEAEIELQIIPLPDYHSS